MANVAMWDASQREAIEKKVTKSWLSNRILPRELQKAGSVSLGVKGEQKKWNIKTTRDSSFMTGGAFQQVPLVQEHNLIQPVAEWASYLTGVPFKWQDIDLSGGDDELWDHKVDSTNHRRDSFTDFLDQQLFTGDGAALNNVDDGATGSVSILGLDQILTSTPTSGNLYGVARSGNEPMQHTAIDGDGGPNSDFASDIDERIMTAIVNTTYKNPAKGYSLESPNLGLCHKNQLVTISSVIVQTQRMAVTEGDAKKLTTGGDSHCVYVHGLPIWWDDSMTNGSIYLLNLSTIKLMFAHSQMIQLIEQRINGTGGDVAVVMKSMPSLQVRYPYMNAVIYNAN